MALSAQIQINPAPIGRIIVREPCTDCGDGTGEAGGTAAIEDRVTLSGRVPEPGSGENPEEAAAAAGRTDAAGQTLSEEELRQVEQLQAADRQVRAHEQAHKTAAGSYAAGGPTFEYTTGPDGKRYATGGEVQIDTSEVPGNPQATIAKAQTIRRAALAPADPSPQDRRVAAEATAMETRARQALQQQRTEESGQDGENSPAETRPGSGPSENMNPLSKEEQGGLEHGAENPSAAARSRKIAQFQSADSPQPGARLNLFS